MSDRFENERVRARIKVGAYYIDFEEARELIKKNVQQLGKIAVKVDESFGYVLAENVKSPIYIPPFSNSAMDGYAIRGIEKYDIFKVVGEVRTGDFLNKKIRNGEAVKIFTGAPVPSGVEAVVMVENTVEENGYIKVLKKPEMGENIRKKGEEIKKGEVVLKKGTIITPPVAGFISELGIAKVKVFRKPKVFCIVTGDEVVMPGQKLKPGKIYDANFSILKNSLIALGIKEFRIKFVKDKPERIEREIRNGLSWADVVITSGGISVGDRDFVRDIVMKLVRPVFYKIKQKPGKPIFFGKSGKKLLFSLPGNPASLYICFIEYVMPALKIMMGYNSPFPQEEEKILGVSVERKKADRTLFLRAKLDGEYVFPLENQESYMLSSLCDANCLAIIPRGENLFEKGRKVKVHIINLSHL